MGCGAPVRGKRRCRRCYQQAWHQANKTRIRTNRKSHGNQRARGSRATVESTLSMALSSLQRTEVIVKQLEAYLGMNAPELPRDDLSILKLFDDLTRPFNGARVSDPDYLRCWSSVFFRVDEAYVRSVGKILNSKEPWRPFCDFANRVSDALYKQRVEGLKVSEDLDFGERCFRSACRHLWSIAFRVATGPAQGRRAVEEIDEFLVRPAQAEKPDRRALQRGGVRAGRACPARLRGRPARDPAPRTGCRGSASAATAPKTKAGRRRRRCHSLDR
jgi:hypothetical protein